MGKALKTELEEYGSDESPEDFNDILAELHHNLHPQWNTEEVLYRPGNEVISMAMLSAWIPGYTGIVASLSVIQIAITALLIFIATRLFGVKLHG